MIEKKWAAVPPVSFTAQGTSLGAIPVTSTLHFRVKMVVVLVHPTLPPLSLQIKRITSPTRMELGSIGASISDRYDLSGYDALTVVYANLQDRPAIPLGEIDRATYEEEPIVARRVFAVDEFGNPAPSGSASNPVNVTGSISVGEFQWDDVKLTRNTDQNIVTAQYYLVGAPVRLYSLSYDSNGNLIEVTKV
jgi:hypothetical protein